MFDGPDWRGDPQQRLRLSLVVAALVLGALMSLLRMPEMAVVSPIGELLVNIIRDEPEPIATPVEPVAEPTSATPAAAQTQSAPAESAESPPDERQWTDWDRVVKDTVSELAAQPPEPVYSVNPNLDRRRAEAAVKFRPSEAPVERPIWENVETDLLGRKVLRSGDCYKVIDDPNVGSREAFETFGQYITICTNFEEKPQQLPWVDEINARREGPSRYAPPSVE